MVKEIIMDRGKEFDNKNMIKLFDKFGIDYKFTSIQDHAANSRAERNIRTITSDIKTLHIQSYLSKWSWSYAAEVARNVRDCTYDINIKGILINWCTIMMLKWIYGSFYHSMQS